MPTNVVEALARKRKEQAQASAHTTMLLVCLIVSLSALILLFAVDSFAEAVQLMGQVEF